VTQRSCEPNPTPPARLPHDPSNVPPAVRPGSGSDSAGTSRFALESVLGNQMQIVALVEDLDLDTGIQLAELPDLSVLSGHQLLVHRGYLDVSVLIRKVEIRREQLGRATVAVPLDRE